MANTIGPQPRAPQWPWGGPRAVRERLVDRAQLDRKVKKKGDPKNPSLASSALMDFIGPAHSAEELRLPMPPMPRGHEADVDGFLDRGHLATASENATQAMQALVGEALTQVRAAPERLDRLKSLLQREAQMLSVVSSVTSDMTEIERRRRQETSEEAY